MFCIFSGDMYLSFGMPVSFLALSKLFYKGF